MKSILPSLNGPSPYSHVGDKRVAVLCKFNYLLLLSGCISRATQRFSTRFLFQYPIMVLGRKRCAGTCGLKSSKVLTLKYFR